MNWVKVSLITQLNGIIAECEAMINRIERGEPLGLGGRLQNVWEVFHLLGQLEKE